MPKPKQPTYHQIHGWFDFETVYQDAVDRAPQHGATFVELGAWLGKSTVAMAKMIQVSKKQITFYTVDTWDGRGIKGLDLNNLKKHEPRVADKLANEQSLLPIFQENLRRCKVRRFVKTLCSTTQEASTHFDDHSLAFVFIDASHDLASVRQDILTWIKKVKPKGTLAGHDYGHPKYPGVKQAVDELLPHAEIVAPYAYCVAV
jgi:hypothetical protein